MRPGSRAIARRAVEVELSLAAYELVVEKGYANVTVDDMAAAGGVSRSTFLRYLGTKDQAILVAWQAHVARMADALRARPAGEDDWLALRAAIEGFVLPIYARHPTGAQAFSRLVLFTPSLARARLEQQDWRTPLARVLAERHGHAEQVPLGIAVKVAAALECVGQAVSYWAAADGQADLADLIEEGFAALSVAARPGARRP